MAHINVPVTAQVLLAALASAPDHRVLVSDPPLAERAAYRRAVYLLREPGALPAGLQLRMTGRDRGDLAIKLVTRQQPPAIRPGAAVVLPGESEPLHPAVAAIASGQLEDVSAESQPRALQILAGLAAEAERREIAFSTGGTSDCSFHLTIGSETFSFRLFEEFDKIEAVAKEGAAAVKYDWQRVSPRRMTAPSGRLVMQLQISAWQHKRWADRNCWTLIDKLPDLLAHVEEQARLAVEEREAAQRAADERLERWEAAIRQARLDYVTDLNQRRVLAQAEKWRTSQLLRDYGAAVRAASVELPLEQKEPALRWAEWTAQRAAELNPLERPGELVYAEPADISPSELERFMPPGLTANHPPTP